MTEPSHVTISVPVEEASGVGEARRVAARLSSRLGFDEAETGRVSLIVTEAASNLLHHGGGGELLLRGIPTPTAPGIEILALDRGPGIVNIADCLRDGFSTRGTSGNGMGAIVRLSTTFDIFSLPGQGTAILARICREDSAPPDERSLEYGVVCVARRGEEVCGDAWAVTSNSGRDVITVMDGLGHGFPAFEAAQQGLRAFWEHNSERPQTVLQSIHAAMSGTRGAVGAVLCREPNTSEVTFVGIGNIGATLVPLEGRSSSLVSYSGTLGHAKPRFQEFHQRMPHDGVLLMHSDGLSSHWTFEPYPGLLRKNPSLIAGVLYRDFASRRDDVVILVARERRKERA